MKGGVWTIERSRPLQYLRGAVRLHAAGVRTRGGCACTGGTLFGGVAGVGVDDAGGRETFLGYGRDVWA